MTITYTWNITELECTVAHGELTNVVTNVHWRLDGSNETGISSGVYGVTALETPADADQFVAFESLEKDQVIGWLESALGQSLTDYKTKIETEINARANPPVVNKAPPWMQAAPTI